MPGYGLARYQQELRRRSTAALSLFVVCFVLRKRKKKKTYLRRLVLNQQTDTLRSPLALC